MLDNNAIHKFKAGDKFHDRYILEKLIEIGAFSDIWCARDLVTQNCVALKIYLQVDEIGINNLVDKYRVLSNLNHKNILRIAYLDVWEETLYLVMKKYRGNLSAMAGELSDEKLLKIVEDVANGMMYLHQKNIIHQDIKPSNILIDEDNGETNYVLGHIDCCSEIIPRVNRYDETMHVFRADYFAPECFSTKKEDRMPDKKKDIFSFVISLYELTTGGLPFDDMPTGRMLRYGDVKIDFSEVKNEKIKRIVSQCLHLQKEDRPTAEEIIEMIHCDYDKHERKGLNLWRSFTNKLFERKIINSK